MFTLHFYHALQHNKAWFGLFYLSNKKSPRGVRPRRCSSSPQGAKYNTATQDTSPSRMAEVCGENSSGRAKTGGLGQVNIKKRRRRRIRNVNELPQTQPRQQRTPHANHIHRSILKSYDVSMVQSTNCINILVTIPCLPEPPFLTALISCKHSCRFSPLRNTGYPMRKLTIHCGNHPPIRRQGKLLPTQHNITPLLYKTQLSKQITFTEA